MTGVYSFQAGNVITLSQSSKTSIVVGVNCFDTIIIDLLMTILDLVWRGGVGGYRDCSLYDILCEQAEVFESLPEAYSYDSSLIETPVLAAHIP